MNFARFAEWPPQAAQASEPLRVCILGGEAVAAALEQMAEREPSPERRIVIRRLRRWEPPCEVLFVPGSERDGERVLAAAGPGVLTVGESAGFLRGGGMISFMIENGRLRFDVNRRAAEAAELRLSSQLLNVARSVIQ